MKSRRMILGTDRMICQKMLEKKRRKTMAKVGIVMGSDSDMPIMSKAADILEKLGIDYEMKIISAHREDRKSVV